MVHKPPEWAPLTASMLGDIALDAGLPPGAYNVVQGIGEEAGAALVSHPGVDRIAFTGSVDDRAPRRAGRRRQPHAAVARARRQVAVPDLRRRGPRRSRPTGDRSVRQRRPGVSGGDAAAGRGASIYERIPRSVRQGCRGDRRGGSARGRHRHRPPDHARNTSSASTDSSAGRSTTGSRRLFGGGPNEDLGGLYYRPTLFVDAASRFGDPDPRGVRPGAHSPAVRRRGGRGRDGERDRLRPRGDRSTQATRTARGASASSSSRAPSGSTASSCAIWTRRSAGRATRGSAARAASGASTSTRT